MPPDQGLAGSSQPDLRRQIQYLKAENQILRSKIEGPVRLTKRERSRLVKLGKPLGDAGWGYTRIQFQLRHLEIKVARSTIIAILKEAGLPTGPERGERTWDEFIRMHSKTLWARDFAHKKVLTKKGWRTRSS